MVGQIVQSPSCTCLVLYSLDTCLSIVLSEYPIVNNNIIDVICAANNSYFLGRELIWGAVEGTTLDCCEDAVITNILYDPRILKAITLLSARWSQGIDTPSADTVKTAESLIKFLKEKPNSGE